MKITLLLLSLLTFTLLANTQQVEPRVSLRFRPLIGSKTPYTVQSDMDIAETSQAEGGTEKRTGSINHSIEYVLTVDSVGSNGVPSVLRLKIGRIVFNNGNPNNAFDSANSSQLDATKRNANLALFGAAISSTSNVEVMPDGTVSKFRLLDFDTSYGEGAGGKVNRIIEEISKYIAFPLASQNVSPGESWAAAVPVKFVGGPLGGHFFDLPGKFRLDRIGESGGERVAWITLALASQPRLDLVETSIENARVDFHVDSLEGSAVFSIDRGQLIDCNFSAATHITVIVRNQIANDHKMKYRLHLKRGV